MSAFNPAPPIRRWPLQAAALLLALAVLLLSPGAARAQSAVPTVTGVAITSSAGPDATYALGQRIRVTLTFSEAVNVSGTPQVAIDMDPAGWGTKLANYLRGGGGTHLTFAHTVVEPNYSTQGVAVLANSLALNGGSVTSVSSGTAAALSHAGLGHDPNHKVNWQMIAPTVTGVAVTSDPGGDDTYAMDDVIEVTLTFSEAVAVTGTPQLAIDMDPAHWGTKWAAYHGGSGSTRLTFTHTVVEPNLSTRGVAVLADSLRRNGGTIRSVSTQTDVQRAHAGLDHDAGHKVDWRIAGCERTAPSSVSALTIGQGAVVSWTLPADLSGACRVTGFVVSAVHLEEPFEQRHHIIDPEARSHTIRGLIPGDHRFAVSVEYAEGESEDFEVAYANNVPDACISLAIKPYARNAVSGRITSVNGTGCEARETFDLELKRSSDDYWRGYSALPWRYVDTQTDASQPHFIFYGIDPHVAYDFRISAYDASDSKYSTTAQSVTIKAQDPSATSAAGSPSARFLANNNGNIVVSWNSYSAPTGRTVTGIALEIKSCSDPAMASCDGAVMSAWVPVSTESSAQWFTRYHRFTGLTNGVYYTARVAARTHASSEPASTATDAWTAWLPATRVWSEPTQVWFSNLLHSNGLLWVQTRNNKDFDSSTRCTGSSDGGDFDIKCAEGTFVSQAATGSVSVSAQHTIDEMSTSSTQSSGQVGGPGAPTIFASGGNGKLVVEWAEAASSGLVGSIDQYIVRHRSGTSGSWTDTVKGVNDRSHTFTGLANGIWQVHVRARTDGDDNDPMTTDTPRLGFQSEILTVTLSADNTDTIIPHPITVIPGNSRSLIVQWGLVTEGSLPYAYQVRHREAGTTAWTESSELFPRATRFICGINSCENPRSYTRTNLTGGTLYEIEVRAKNANGWSGWSHTRTARPND